MSWLRQPDLWTVCWLKSVGFDSAPILRGYIITVLSAVILQEIYWRQDSVYIVGDNRWEARQFVKLGVQVEGIVDCLAECITRTDITILINSSRDFKCIKSRRKNLRYYSYVWVWQETVRMIASAATIYGLSYKTYIIRHRGQDVFLK